MFSQAAPSIVDAIRKLFQEPGFAAVFGIAVGGIISYLLAVRLARYNARQQAGGRLRDVMYEFLAWYEGHINFSPDMADRLQRQRAATLEFKTFLSKGDRAAFNKAWHTYAEPEDESNEYWIVRDKAQLAMMEEKIEALVAFTRKRSFWSF